ncbi:DUF4352 domain-containing protein [Hathewaya histolytica]|uniref:Lipoprotein n=1 Tax=Hathewaya histolytica TaxID=1498 RepID=A0A4U9RAS6_HATHI|nr:DUF4352 domain-containing protein [Hathewaya histolytica]VTQ88775.1 lipoprotein [Hathewaya histolytica]
MKKRLIIEVVCGILIFAVGFLVGDNSAVNRVNKTISTTVENKQENSTKNATQQVSNTKDNNQEKNNETKISKLGEEGKSGKWNMKVLEVKETNTVQGGNSSDNKTTKDKFIVVKLQIKNISKEPIQYSEREFMLGNMKDKAQYNINDIAFDAMQSANSKESIYKKNSEFIGVYKDVNPNTTKQTYLVFEVPKDMNISDSVLLNSNSESEPVGFYLN